MADLSVQNITKYFGDRLVLEDICFDIQPGEKVALLGANGTGKTTLLNIITGRLAYDQGNVVTGAGRTIGVIDQMPDFSKDITVEDVLRSAFQESDALARQMAELEAEMEKNANDAGLLKRYGILGQRLEMLGGYNHDFEIDKVANGLEIPKAQFTQPFSLLSGGEQTRINLARIILEHTDILLLDEPTNHLDMGAVAWLGEYLEKYQGTVLTISHDRWFLDQCCDRIIELCDHHCEFYAGNYSFYAVEREKRMELKQAKHENELAEKKRLEAVSRKMHEHGTEHLAKRAASIDKRIARMQVSDRPRPEKKMTMTFGDPNYETEDILKVRQLSKSYDGRQIFDNISFEIHNGERVALLGDNGAGKTTMLRILLGEESADGGVVKKGIGLKPAYLPQKVHFENESRNLIDTLIYDKNVSMQTARTRLGAFRFSGETQMKRVGNLSGGEKSRLRLCELMYDSLNMLILDEPTNHLDILAREWLEEAVEGFNGTLLFVSHDRYFVERFATRIIYLTADGYLDYQGTYSEFLRYQQSHSDVPPKVESSVTQKLKKAAPTLDDVPKPEKKGKKTGGTKMLQKQLNAIEREISQLESTSAELEQKMIEAASDSQKLLEFMAEKETCDESLMAKMEEWEAISMELDRAT